MASMPRLHDENFLRRSEYSSTCKDGFRSLERVQEKQKTGFARFLNKNHPSNKGIAKCTESPESMLPWLTMTCLLYCWSDRVDICVKSCHLCLFSPPFQSFSHGKDRSLQLSLKLRDACNHLLGRCFYFQSFKLRFTKCVSVPWKLPCCAIRRPRRPGNWWDRIV